MTTDRRLDAARAILSHLCKETGPGFGFELWDGSMVPADHPGDGLRVAVSDGAVLTRLARRPRLDTFIDLYAAGHVDIRGGSLFDIVEQRPKVRSRELRSKIDKGLVLKNAWPILAGSRSLANAEADQIGTSDAVRSGSDKDDIAFHYDAGNEFYRLFLDPEMVYTCAYFRDWSNELATAQHDKLEMICRKLRLQPGDRFLDIGCGWGALICHAATHRGVTAVGVTLSEEQAALARERIEERGLADRVTVELCDFRDLDGQFDKIASIGMFEAVGIDHHDSYYATVHRLLRPRGLYLHHAITRRGKKSDKEFRRKRPEYQALVRYIFPGGEVDHIGMTLKSMEVHSFEVHDTEAWREHYARTTRLWAENLERAKEAAIAEVGARRYRIWLAYLTGVSIAFDRGTIGIFQTVASKRQRGASGLPPTREDLYR